VTTATRGGRTALIIPRPLTYTIEDDGKAITCQICRRTSWNDNDVKYRYCDCCRAFHDEGSDPPTQE
jgi:hypothetical protein